VADRGSILWRGGAYTEAMRAIVLAAVLVLGVGCGGTGHAARSTATATVTGGGAVRVTMRHNRFAPHRIVVRLGQTVRWTNHDAVAHTVASAQLRLSSEAIRAGTSFSYRPRRRGRFAYYCTIHAGQTGVLVVR
jgi:plastocyanin